MRTSCPPGAAAPFALHHDHKDPPSVSGRLLALWSSMNSANCLRSGKFLCHRDTLISKSQMELRRGCIIYVKLLFLPGNLRIFPICPAHREKWPVPRWKQAHIVLIVVIIISQLNRCSFTQGFFFCTVCYCLAMQGLKFGGEVCLHMHGNIHSWDYAYTVWETAFMLMLQPVQNQSRKAVIYLIRCCCCCCCCTAAKQTHWKSRWIDFCTIFHLP